MKTCHQFSTCYSFYDCFWKTWVDLETWLCMYLSVLVELKQKHKAHWTGSLRCQRRADIDPAVLSPSVSLTEVTGLFIKMEIEPCYSSYAGADTQQINSYKQECSRMKGAVWQRRLHVFYTYFFSNTFTAQETTALCERTSVKKDRNTLNKCRTNKQRQLGKGGMPWTKQNPVSWLTICRHMDYNHTLRG